MSKLKQFFSNKWTKFSLVAIIYVLWFVVWTGNLWWLIGVPIIYDIYISKLMYKYIGIHHTNLKQRSKAYKTAADWIGSILFAVIVASLAHTFLFQLYFIPSSSMEGTMLVGDYLYVSKLTYGPQMPNTPVSFPLVHHTMPFSKTKKSFSEIIQWPYHRLKGLRNVERNDIVVFNFPAGDTVLLEMQERTYYDVLREYQRQFGKEEGRRRLFSDYTVITRPVDKRENYIKRCVAIPNDTIQIIDGQVMINGLKQIEIPELQYLYFVDTNSPISIRTFNSMGIEEAYGSGLHYQMNMTAEEAEAVAAMNKVESVTRYRADGSSEDFFPNDSTYKWNTDNFGPLWIPSKGATVKLTAENLPLYRRIIEVYEHNSLETDGDRIIINGKPTDAYTFKMNYYFMMGDNRHNSADSRFWGFIPEDHVVGKASFIWFSKDKSRKFPGNIRWNRMFKKAI